MDRSGGAGPSSHLPDLPRSRNREQASWSCSSTQQFHAPLPNSGPPARIETLQSLPPLESLQRNATFTSESDWTGPSLSAQACAFLRLAAADLKEDCLALSFLPLPEDLVDQFPERILAPSPEGGLLDWERAEQMVDDRRYNAVVGVCTFGCEEEREASFGILQQVQAFRPISVFIVILLPNKMEPSQDLTGAILEFQNELLSLGVTDIILNPGMCAGDLAHHVGILRQVKVHHDGRRKAKMLLRKQKQQVRALEQKQDLLLWDIIPRIVLPKFPLYDERLHEDSTGVGEYKFVYRHESRDGLVLAATNARNEPVAVKVVPKMEVSNPEDVEDIYREGRCLSKSFKHDNIVQCVDFLHTGKYVYIVLKNAGSQNLEEYCSLQPGSHLAEMEAMSCFKQILSALAYMHRKSFAHRQVSLNHVVVEQRGQAHPHCTLIDFRDAILVKGKSAMACGSLPSIAPEVAFGALYDPFSADSWSSGILLLEMAGGLSSLSRSVTVNFQEESIECVEAIVNLFESEEGHKKALAMMNGVKSPRILHLLEELVVVNPRRRARLPDLEASWQGA